MCESYNMGWEVGLQIERVTNWVYCIGARDFCGLHDGHAIFKSFSL